MYPSTAGLTERERVFQSLHGESQPLTNRTDGDFLHHNRAALTTRPRRLSMPCETALIWGYYHSLKVNGYTLKGSKSAFFFFLVFAHLFNGVDSISEGLYRPGRQQETTKIVPYYNQSAEGAGAWAS